MARQPLRSFFVLLLLGVILLTIALVVRSGMWEPHTRDEPTNSAMRAALAERQNELTTEDSMRIYDQFPTAYASQSGLRYLVRQPGKGPTPHRGDQVTGYYAARLLDGTEVDNRYATGHPVTFRVGSNEIMPAFDEMFIAMRRGEKRTLIVPHWLGYRADKRPAGVSPTATLIVEVERL